MNVGLHQRAERIIYQPVCLNPAQAPKLFRDDADPKMPHTAFGARMTGVQVTLILNIQVDGFERVRQPCTNLRNSFSGHGKSVFVVRSSFFRGHEEVKETGSDDESKNH